MADLLFEWDAAKARANLRKHRVSFVEAITVFRDALATIQFPRFGNGVRPQQDLRTISPMNMIRVAESDSEIARCGPVLRQLHAHVAEAEFLPTVRRQEVGGYRLAYLEEDGQVRTVAGFRVIDNLADGRLLYVDDLVTDHAHRSRGHGGALFGWLVQKARDQNCQYLGLDSGVQRFDAHRFYLAKRMIISSHRFTLKL